MLIGVLRPSIAADQTATHSLSSSIFSEGVLLDCSSVQATNVTLGERARELCRLYGIDESAIKQARAGSQSVYEGREYLIISGELPDGSAIRLSCQYDRSNHVVTFRPL